MALPCSDTWLQDSASLKSDEVAYVEVAQSDNRLPSHLLVNWKFEFSKTPEAAGQAMLDFPSSCVKTCVVIISKKITKLCWGELGHHGGFWSLKLRFKDFGPFPNHEY